ncbi:MAG: hypothetical protein HC860_14130 [Alkalinema sp. RU_4_3]|nr:hypothetical protein [Alkalinema sp. RU_4_3]
MKKVFLLLGLIASSSLAITVLWPRSQAVAQAPSDSVCQLTTTNGQSLDLSQLCGKSSNSPTMISIDPNTPVPVQMVGQSKPSELWNSLPDLPAPPQAGKTQTPPAGSLPAGVAQPAVSPK